MIKQGKGKAINISSIGGLLSARNEMSYDAAKACVPDLTRAFAVELGTHHITVNAIAPGIVETPMTASWLANRKMVDGFLRTTPLGCLGRPKDIAAAAAFLAFEDSDFITGQVIVVDEGILAGGLWVNVI